MPSARESAEANKSNNHRYAKQHDDPTRTKYVVVVVYKKKGKWGVRAIDIGPSPSIKWKVSKLEHGDGLCGGKKKTTKQTSQSNGRRTAKSCCWSLVLGWTADISEKWVRPFYYGEAFVDVMSVILVYLLFSLFFLRKWVDRLFLLRQLRFVSRTGSEKRRWKVSRSN